MLLFSINLRWMLLFFAEQALFCVLEGTVSIETQIIDG